MTKKIKTKKDNVVDLILAFLIGVILIGGLSYLILIMGV
jgi:hypothetical protein